MGDTAALWQGRAGMTLPEVHDAHLTFFVPVTGESMNRSQLLCKAIAKATAVLWQSFTRQLDIGSARPAAVTLDRLEPRTLLSDPQLLSAQFEFRGTSQYLEYKFDQSVAATFSAASVILSDLTSDGVSEDLNDYLHVSFFDGGKEVHVSWPTLPALWTIDKGHPHHVLSDGLYLATLTIPIANPDQISLPFAFLAGDFDGNNVVEFDDLLTLAQNYGQTTGATFATGDSDYDGDVDFDDLLRLSQRYGGASVGLPGSPNLLNAGNPTDQTATLLWAPPEEDYTGFRIERSEDNVAFAPIPGATFSADPEKSFYKYVDTDLADGKRYWYQVVSFDGTVDNTPSNKRSVLTVLPMPTDFSALDVRSTSVTLVWRDNARFEAGYLLEHSADGGLTWNATQHAAISGRGPFTYQVTGLNADTTYLFRLHAYTGSVSSPTARSARTLPITVKTTGTTSSDPLVITGPTDLAHGEEGRFHVQGGATNGYAGTLFYQWTVRGGPARPNSGMGSEFQFTPKGSGVYTIDVVALGNPSGPVIASHTVVSVSPAAQQLSIVGAPFAERERTSVFRLHGSWMNHPVMQRLLERQGEMDNEDWQSLWDETVEAKWYLRNVETGTWVPAPQSGEVTLTYDPDSDSVALRSERLGDIDIRIDLELTDERGQSALAFTATRSISVREAAPDLYKKNILTLSTVSDAVATEWWLTGSDERNQGLFPGSAIESIELPDGKILRLSVGARSWRDRIAHPDIVPWDYIPGLGALQRLNADMTIDETFGQDLVLGGLVPENHPDLAGQWDGTGSSFFERRDGALFIGTPGRSGAIIPGSARPDFVGVPWGKAESRGPSSSHLAVDAQGRILIATPLGSGQFWAGNPGPPHGWLVLRFTSEGAIDTAFGAEGNGTVYIPPEITPAFYLDTINQIEISPYDGSIWIGGGVIEPTNVGEDWVQPIEAPVLLKLGANGEMSSSPAFILPHKPFDPRDGMPLGAFTKFVFQDDSAAGYRVLATGFRGQSWNPAIDSTIVAAFLPDGALDTTFGQNGVVDITIFDVEVGSGVDTTKSLIGFDIDLSLRNEIILTTSQIGAIHTYTDTPVSGPVSFPTWDVNSETSTYNPTTSWASYILRLSDTGVLLPFGEDADEDGQPDGNAVELLTPHGGWGRMTSAAVVGSGDRERIFVVGVEVGKIEDNNVTMEGGGVVYSLLPDGRLDSEFGSGGFVMVGTPGAEGAPGVGPYPIEAGIYAGWSDVYVSRTGELILSGHATQQYDPGSDPEAPWGHRNYSRAITARYDPRPAAVSDLSASLRADGTVDLVWAGGSNQIRGFEIRRALSEAALTSVSDEDRTTFIIGREFEYNDRLVVPNTRYYYKVYPIFDNGVGGLASATNVASVTTWAVDDGAVLQDTLLVDLAGGDTFSNIKLLPNTRYQITASGLFNLSWNNVNNLASMQTADAEFGYLPNAWVLTPGPNDRVPARVPLGGGIDYGISVRTLKTGEPFQDAFLGEVRAATEHSSAVDENKGVRWGPTPSSGDYLYSLPYMLDAAPGDSTARPLIFRYHDSFYGDNHEITGGRPLTVKIYRSVPSRPGDLQTVVDRSNKRVELSWRNLASDGEVITIERALGNGSFATIATVGASITSYVDTPATPALNSIYRYRVSVKNGFASSGYSNEATAVFVSTAPVIDDFEPQIAQLYTEFQFRVSARDAEDGEDGLTYSLTSDRPGITFSESDPALIVGWTPDEEEPGTTYRIAVTVTDQDGLQTTRPLFVTITPSLNTIPRIISAAKQNVPLSSDVEGKIALTTLAADNGPESALTYTWTVLQKPIGAPAPTFTINGTNAAKQTVAQVKMAGEYRFKVIVSDGTSWTVDSSTPVGAITVGQIRTKVTISPSQTVLAAGQSVIVRAMTLDQFDRPIAGVTGITWQRTGSLLGAFTTDGELATFTAPAFANYAADFQVTLAPTVPGLRAGSSAQVLVQHRHPANAVPMIDMENVDAEVLTISSLRLTARDAYDLDGPEAELNYHWTIDANALPAGVSMSDLTLSAGNGTNAGKDITFTTTKPEFGLGYTFKLVIIDQYGGQSVETTLALTDNQAPSTIRMAAQQADGSFDPIQRDAYLNASTPGGAQYSLILRATAVDASGRIVLPSTPDLEWVWEVNGVTAQSVAGEPNQLQLSSVTEGALQVRAKVRVGSGNPFVEQIYIVHVIGEQEPVFQIHGPANSASQGAAKISMATPISIVAADPNPGDEAQWELWLRDPDGNRVMLAKDTKHAGAAPGTPAVVATLNPTLYRNGLYTLELADGSNGLVKDARVLRIETLIKTGGFTLPITDLKLDLPNGDTAELTRIYDSTRATIEDEFGFGWRYELKKGSVRTSSNVSSSIQSGMKALKYNDLVYLNVPNVGELAFAFMPKPYGVGAQAYPRMGIDTDGVQRLITDPFALMYQFGEYYPQFVSVDGSSAQLTLSNSSARLAYLPEYKEFRRADAWSAFDANLTHFGQEYLLTLPDGTRYKINALNGEVKAKIDPNDNVTSYASTSGFEIRTEKTGTHITKAGIWDLTLNSGSGGYVGGKFIQYAYDVQGNLEKVIDRNGIEMTFGYGSGAQAHYLTSVKDPSGNVVLSASYTDLGELTELRDAAGNPAKVKNGAFAGELRSTATDANADVTEQVLNAYGDLIRTIKTIKNPDGTVKEYLVTVSDYWYRESVLSSDLGDTIKYARSPLNQRISEVHYHPFTVTPAQAAQRYSMSPVKKLQEIEYSLDPEIDTRGSPVATTVYESDPDNPSTLVARTTRYHDFVNGRAQVVEQVIEGEDSRFSFFKYDSAGNLEWTLDANGVGMRTKYSTGTSFQYPGDSSPTASVADLPKGLALVSYRIRNTPLVPAAGDKLPTVDPDSFTSEVTSINRYYAPTASQGSASKLQSVTSVIRLGLDEVTTSYTYTADGDTQQVSRSVKNTTAANVTTVTSTIDSYTEYDVEGRPIKVWEGDSASATTPFTETFYDDFGRAYVTRDSFGRFTVNTYDRRGNVIRTNYPDGTEVRTFYDALGRAAWVSERFVTTTSVTVVRSTTTHAVTVTFGATDETSTYKVTRSLFDSAGRSVGSETYRDAQIGLAADGTLLSALEPSQALLEYSGKLLSRSTTIFNAEGRVAETVSPTGLRNGTTYYADGRVRKTGTIVRTQPGQAAPANAELLGAGPNGTVDWLTEMTSYTYGGRETVGGATYEFDTVTGPTGAVTKTMRSIDGLRTITRRYNAASPATYIETRTVQAPAGVAITDYAMPSELQSVLGTFGSHSAAIDELNRVTHRVTDTNGRLTDVWLPPIDDATDGTNDLKWSHWRYTYDASGNQSSQIDPREMVTSFTYDDYGRRLSRTLPADSDDNPANDTEHWTYDAMGRVRLHIDFKGQTTWYTYDDANGGRAAAEYRYNAAISPSPTDTPATYSTTHLKEKTTYGYDTLGRQNVVTEYADGNMSVAVRTETTTFDPITGQVASVTTPEGTINYDYYPTTGRLLRTWTTNTETVYTYDSHGRLTDTVSLRLKGVVVGTFGGLDVNGKPIVSGSPIVLRHGYGVAGQLEWTLNNQGTTVTSDDIFTDYSYDGLGRLHAEVVTRGGTVDQSAGTSTGGTSIFSQTFVLRADGQRTQVTETRDDSSTSTTAWEYDAQGHLAREERTGSNAYVHEFGFDLSGNRIFKKVNGVQTGYQYNERNQLKGEDANNNGSINDAADTRYTYDPNGATITTITNGTTSRNKWNLRGRLESIDQNDNGVLTDAGDVTYVYDSQGVRVSKNVTGTGLTVFVIDYLNLTGHAKPIEELASAGGAVVRSYFIGTEVIAELSDSNFAQTRILMRDVRGYARALVATTGIVERNDFDAFGSRLGGGMSSTRWQSSDGYHDPETGAFYHLQRYRQEDHFWSEDPTIFGAGGTLDANLYRYAAGNPVRNGDPTGLTSTPELATTSSTAGLMMTIALRGLGAGLRVAHAIRTVAGLTAYRAALIAGTRIGASTIVGLEALNIVGFLAATPAQRLEALGADPTHGAMAGLGMLLQRSSALAKRALSLRAPSMAMLREEVEGLRNVLNIINRSGSGYGSGGLSNRTIASLYGDIDGVPIEMIAHSGQGRIPGTVPYMGERLLEGGSTANFRQADAERKIFETLHAALQGRQNVRGRLRLIVNHPNGGPVCPDCMPAIADFKYRYPEIDLEIIDR